MKSFTSNVLDINQLTYCEATPSTISHARSDELLGNKVDTQMAERKINRFLIMGNIFAGAPQTLHKYLVTSNKKQTWQLKLFG